ncbi:MAG TPA: DUF2569 family protein [Candidatus Sulfotelmatobacter sp.]|nr:DUF2569 family protein [Candidatus Sulfotelmatobacter sp.]
MSTTQAQAEGISTATYEGVLGWLLVLCLTLTFAYPAATLYQIFTHTIPGLLNAHDLKRAVLFGVYAALFLSVTAFSVVAGIRLWLIKPGAVKLAKRWLLTFLCAHLAYFVFWILLMRDTRPLGLAEMGWHHVAGPLPSFFLWTVYLEHSKRVRATYPME